MKKFLLSALSLVTVAALAITGTIAFLQDEDSDVNVMTVGNVDIEQHEYQRAEGIAYDAGDMGAGNGVKEGALVPFVQGQKLYPAVPSDATAYTAEQNIDNLFFWGDYVYSGTAGNGLWNDSKLSNVMDKMVFVENTGKSDAYFRTIIAFECPEGMAYSQGSDKEFMMNTNIGANYEWESPGYIVIDGTRYYVMVATYQNALKPGNQAHPSLLQVVMTHNATNEDMEKLGDSYEILVLSQAVQTAGFADEKTALNTAFGEVNTTTAAEWFGGVLDSQDFAGGAGTKELPYLIDEPAQLMNISNYDEYTYFKVADGVDTLDMTGVGKIRLNGSFDGNGVTMNNLTTALFEYVGKSGEAQDIKISNLTANVNTTDGRGLVRNIFNPGTTTFENVALHGYIEGQYNMGSFYNYGTANAGDSDGANYTINFVNATSDVTLVCTSGNAIGGMLGHGYEGADYMLSINMDDASGYTGQMYTTGTATCYEVMAMCSHATYKLNGEEVSRYSHTYPSTKLTAVAPEAGADGYYVDPVDGVDHYVVSLEAQLTAYDENDVKIPNMSGLTWSMGKKTVTSGFEGKVLDLVTSAEIVNDENKPIGYEIDGGVLKAYTGRDTNYKSGWFTLNVTQYDANGTILATGNLRVFTIAEP